jgi:hypothetical protein
MTPRRRQVLIADPLLPNPFAPTHKYSASWSRVVAAILLGIVTYDANLLTITPSPRRGKGSLMAVILVANTNEGLDRNSRGSSRSTPAIT